MHTKKRILEGFQLSEKNNRKVSINDKMLLYAYTLVLVLFPCTQISVPAFGLLEFLMGDLILLFLFSISIYKLKFNRTYESLFWGTFFFILLQLISIIKCKVLSTFFVMTIPLVHAFVFVTTSLFVLSKMQNWRLIRTTLFWLLVIFSIPVYIDLFTGIRFENLYLGGVRYMFLTKNPNQLMACILLYMITVIFIDANFYKKNLKKDLLLTLFLVLPILFTGSRTGLAACFGLILILSFYLYTITGVAKKLAFSTIVISTFIYIIFSGLTLSRVETQNISINRAIGGIFFILEGNNLIKDGSASGRSMAEGKEQFKKNIFLGVGLGNMLYYTTDNIEVHNSYISILSETGLFGALGFLIFIFCIIKNIVFSSISLPNKILGLAFLGLFLMMNITHILTRQRWTWVYLVLTFIFIKAVNNRNSVIKHKKLFLLNQS